MRPPIACLRLPVLGALTLFALTLSALTLSALTLTTLTLIGSAGRVAAQPPQTATVHCTFCKNQGFKPCKRHKAAMIELEAGVLFCSVVADCKECEGTMQHDCKYCRNTVVEESARHRQAAVAAWRAGRRTAVDQYTKSPGILHGKSKHFDLSFSLQKMKVGKRLVATHELMHLYLERLEALYADFCKVLELKEQDFLVPGDIYVFQKQVDHVEITPRKTGSGAGVGSGRKYMGDKMVFCMWKAPHVLTDDDDVHRYLAHNVTHLLVNHTAPATFIYNKGHGWLDAGLAHWFEMRVGGLCTTFCYEEIALDPGVGFNRGLWKSAVRKLVDEGKAGPFAEFYQLNTDQLSLPAHALSFAYVDFLITVHGGARLRDLLRALKQKTPTRDALQKIYGLSTLSIDEEFRSFVKKTYPLREPPRRK